MPKDEKPTKSEGAQGRSAAEAEKPLSQDLQEIQSYYQMMVDEGLDFLEIKDADSLIRLSRQPQRAAASPVALASPLQEARLPSQAKPAPPAAGNSQPSIVSPLAGLFYRASSPSASAFVKEGDVVEAGQTLCIVEAMKVMNEIKAEARCKIARIVAENARPVTAGQPLFFVEPA